MSDMFACKQMAEYVWYKSTCRLVDMTKWQVCVVYNNTNVDGGLKCSQV